MALIIKKITCTLVFSGAEPVLAAPAPKVLDWTARRQLEDTVGGELGDVKIYSNPEISRWLGDLRADAAASGSNVFIREGKYESETAAGRGLLAHELTHVSQAGAESSPGGEAQDPEVEALANENRVRCGKGFRAAASRKEPGSKKPGLHFAGQDRPLLSTWPAASEAVAVAWRDGSSAVLEPGDLEKAFIEAARRLEERHERF